MYAGFFLIVFKVFNLDNTNDRGMADIKSISSLSVFPNIRRQPKELRPMQFVIRGAGIAAKQHLCMSLVFITNHRSYNSLGLYSTV